MSPTQSGSFSMELGDRRLNDTNRLPYDVLPLGSPSASYHNLAVYPPRPPITSQHGVHYDPEQAHAPPHSQSFHDSIKKEHEAGRRAHLISVDGGTPKTKVGARFVNRDRGGGLIIFRWRWGSYITSCSMRPLLPVGFCSSSPCWE